MRILYNLLAGLVWSNPTLFEATKEGECDLTCESTQTRLDYVEGEISKLTNDVKALKTQNSQLQERVDSLHTQVNGPVKAASSCQEHWDNGMRENGVYQIQPTLSYEPFDAVCTFDGDEVETMLVRTHKKWPTYTATPGGSDGCADPGCFKDEITYNANADQLEVSKVYIQFFKKLLGSCSNLTSLWATCLSKLYFQCHHRLRLVGGASRRKG